MTQNPVGPVPHESNGCVHTVCSKDCVILTENIIGTVFTIPINENKQRDAFQVANALVNSNGFRCSMILGPSVIKMKYVLTEVSGIQ
jgi:hypothetical protein